MLNILKSSIRTNKADPTIITIIYLIITITIKYLLNTQSERSILSKTISHRSLLLGIST